MGEMVEMEAIRVDWLDGRAGRVAEDGMEADGRTRDWRNNGGAKKENDDEQEVNRKRKRGVTLGDNNENDADDDGEKAEESMLELRLSLVVAGNVPSPHRQQSEKPGSLNADHHHSSYYRNGQINNNHRQQLQHQQTLGPTTVVAQSFSSAGEPLHGSSSPQENQPGSSRANLTASLKHLVSQQQPSKHKAAPRTLPGSISSPRHPLQYQASSPGPQFPRLQPQVARSSFPHTFQHEGPEVGESFHGMRRLPLSAQAPSQATTGSLGGHGPQSSGHFNTSHLTAFSRDFLQHNQQQPRALQVNHLYSRSVPPEVLQHSLPLGDGPQPGQTGSPGQGAAPLAPARIFPANIMAQGPNFSVAGSQPQTLLHHQASNAVSLASRRQTILPFQAGVSTIGKNVSVSAFPAVRPSGPSNSAKDPTSTGDDSARDRVDDNSFVVPVCDRKVKLTSELDSSSLYALCRRWVRNDVFRRDQSSLPDCRPLPRPLPTEPGISNPRHVASNKVEENAEQQEFAGPIEAISERDLLRRHVEHYKRVRKRSKEDRIQRIARFMPRLALLLPPLNSDSRLAERLHLPDVVTT